MVLNSNVKGSKQAIRQKRTPTIQPPQDSHDYMTWAIAPAVARSMQNGAFQHRNNNRTFKMKQSLSM